MNNKKSNIFLVIGPGILIAATGVGAGDMITASLGGSAVGVTILWAALTGVILKWFLTEGIARWQLSTGTTILEGWIDKLGNWIKWIFLVYLIAWTFFTGGALINACGVAGTGLIPLSENLEESKIIWGIIHSFTGLFLVFVGGYKLFEKMMSVCIGIMFITVTVTALLIKPDWYSILRGLIIPSIPQEGTVWILGIIGGIGGTVTILSYGYWIREKNRSGIKDLKICRIDLAVGYLLTALFGIAMIIIGSKVQITGRGANIAPILASQLIHVMGPAGGWIFLIGFWGAVFSSLLGVWQSVPYLFSDFLIQQSGKKMIHDETIDLTKTKSYKIYLCAISVIPLPLLWMSLKTAQLTYAILGSLFLPLLALTLLIMNNNKKWIGKEYRNGITANIVLIITLVFFIYIGISKIIGSIKYLLEI